MRESDEREHIVFGRRCRLDGPETLERRRKVRNTHGQLAITEAPPDKGLDKNSEKQWSAVWSKAWIANHLGPPVCRLLVRCLGIPPLYAAQYRF
jgi:hypothetical protein